MELERNSSSSVADLIISPNCPPLVLHGLIDHWNARRWNIELLSHQVKGKLSCKLSPKTHQNLWETQCIHEFISLEEFAAWGKSNEEKSSPLNKYKPEDFSCYIDYKYMKDIASDKILKDVDWGVFGFPDRDGKESTIWIGSEGCYTNCHYDTYGFNLVAQIQGRKQWILFPPWETSYLYPTRIPYEESSVFSEVNVKNPDLQQHPQFQKARPYTVILEPGQVLYVPRHWWHFVESLEDSISVNTWIEMTEDFESRVSEAVTRCLISPLVGARDELSDEETESDSWINPGEEILSPDANLQLLQLAISLRHHKTEEQKSSRKMFCEAVKNLPIRDQNRLMKRKRKHSHEDVGNEYRKEPKVLSMETGVVNKHGKKDNSREEDSDEQFKSSRDLQCKTDMDGPYIVVVQSEVKDESDDNLKSDKKSFTSDNRKECEQSLESDSSSKLDKNLVKTDSRSTQDISQTSSLLEASDNRSELFRKLVKSVTHPNVIQEIIKELHR